MRDGRYNPSIRACIRYLITDLEWGGAERALYELARRLDRSRWEVRVLSLKAHGEVAKRLREDGIPAEGVGLRSPADVRGWWRLGRALRSGRTDLIHTFLFHANVAGRLLAPLAGNPPVVSSIRVEEPRRSHLAWERLTQGWVQVETCVSRSAVRYMERGARIPRDKLVCVYNGVDPISGAGDRALLRRKLGLPPDRPVLLSVGRLDTQKGYDLLLKALPALGGALPAGAVVVIAGTGPLEATLKRQAQEGGLREVVRFVGWQANVADWYRSADLFVLASRWEGVPNSLLEAKAAALPVVATSVGGCIEAVRDTVDGFLVDPFDPAPMAQAVRLLLENPAQARQMGERGRDWVLDRFSWDRMVHDYESLYRALLKL